MSTSNQRAPVGRLSTNVRAKGEVGGIADNLAEVGRVGQFLTEATRILDEPGQFFAGKQGIAQAIPGGLAALIGPLQFEGHTVLL